MKNKYLIITEHHQEPYFDVGFWESDKRRDDEFEKIKMKLNAGERCIKATVTYLAYAVPTIKIEEGEA